MLPRLFLVLFLLAPAFSFAEEIDLPKGYELIVSDEPAEKALEEEPLPKVPYLESLPSTVIGGCVNAVSGDFFESQADLAVPGPRPLVVQRTWSNADRKWHLSHKPKFLLAHSDGRHHLDCLYIDDSGSGMVFRGPRRLGDLDYPAKSLKVPNKLFKKAINNCGAGEISGQTNWKNAAIYYVKKDYHDRLLFRHGSHSDRIFALKGSGPITNLFIVRKQKGLLIYTVILYIGRANLI